MVASHCRLPFCSIGEIFRTCAVLLCARETAMMSYLLSWTASRLTGVETTYCQSCSSSQRSRELETPHFCMLMCSTPVLLPFHSHTTSENMATWRRLQDLTSLSCTSNTSHCFALKNVEGPTGGPSSGETTILRFPPTCIPLMPSSNPAHEKHFLLHLCNLRMQSMNLMSGTACVLPSHASRHCYHLKP